MINNLKVLLVFILLPLVAVSVFAVQDVSVNKTNEGLSAINISDTATFRINVTNNGTTVNDSLVAATLNDTFDQSVLNYSSSAILFNNSLVTLDDSAAASGYVTWTFNLSVNDSFLVEINFTALASANTTNNATVRNSSAVTLGSSSADVEVLPDTTAPVATINEPINNTNISDSTPEINFTLTDNLDTTLNYTVFVNGSANGQSGTADNGTKTNISLSSLPDGTHTVIVQATDDAGNTDNSSELTITVDTSGPSITITSPSDNSFVGANYSINGTVSDSGVGVDNVSIYLNDSFVGTATISGSGWNFTTSTSHGVVNNITAIAYDNVGNNGSDSVTSVTVDTQSPVISSISVSKTTTSATITWQTNENADSLIEYGTSQSLGTSTSNATPVTSHSITLSSLSSSTQYYYNITSCYAAGNCNTTGPNTFTTDAASSSSSGGGGGGGSYTPSEVSSTPEKVRLSKLGTHYFILPGETKHHSVRISSIKKDNVTFEIRSEPVYVTLSEAESSPVDIDGDGSDDIIITLTSFTYSSVIFEVRSAVSEDVAETTESQDAEAQNEEAQDETQEDTQETVVETTQQTETTEEATQSETTQESSSEAVESESRMWLVASLLILVLAILGVAYWRFRK